MAITSLEQEILAVEAKRIQAMVDKDLPTLDSILADDLTYTHSGGRMDRKASFMALIEDPANKYEGIDYSETEVQPAGAEATVVRGRAQIRLLRPSGERLSYPVWFLVAYAKRDSRWQLVAWQATRIPD